MIAFLQTIDKLKDMLDKENITYSIDLFYSKEGLHSLDREPFSVICAELAICILISLTLPILIIS